MIPNPANADVRARTHISEGGADIDATSANSRPRPHLRVVTGGADSTHIKPATPDSHTAEVFDDLADALNTHPVANALPPTWREAVDNLWPAEHHYGLLGQIGSALLGIAQALGLAVCWAVAHVAFATKTRTLIALVVLAVSLAVYAVANLAAS